MSQQGTQYKRFWAECYLLCKGKRVYDAAGYKTIVLEIVAENASHARRKIDTQAYEFKGWF